MDYDDAKPKTLLSDRAQEKGLDFNFEKVKVSDSNGFIQREKL